MCVCGGQFFYEGQDQISCAIIPELSRVSSPVSGGRLSQAQCRAEPAQHILIPQHIVQHWVHMGLRGHTDSGYQYRLQLQQDFRARHGQQRQPSSEVTRAQVAAQAFQSDMDPAAA